MRVARPSVRVSFLVSIAVLAAACSSASQKSGPDASLIPDAGIDSAAITGDFDVGTAAPVDTAPPRLFTVSPASIDLGVLPLAALPARPAITLTAGRDIYYLSVSTTSSDLFLDGASTCKTKLAAGESCVVVVEITRSITGSVVVRADGEIATIPVAAVVRVPGKLAVTPPSVSFPAGGGPSIKINMGNIGGEAIGPITVTVTGANAEEFIATPTGCDFLAPGATCAISVTFVPTTLTFAVKSALLVATGPGPDFVTVSANLNAPSTGGPNPLAITPPSKDFGSVAIGATSAWVTFTVHNTSRAAKGPFAVAIDKTHFVVADDTCTGSLLGGTSGDASTAASCTFGVAFHPGALGATWALLSVSDSTGTSAVAPLTGTGVAPSTDASIAEPDADALDAGLASPLDGTGLDVGAASDVDAGSVD